MRLSVKESLQELLGEASKKNRVFDEKLQLKYLFSMFY